MFCSSIIDFIWFVLTVLLILEWILQFNVFCMFLLFFIKVKNMFFYVFYLQINVFNIYAFNYHNKRTLGKVHTSIEDFTFYSRLNIGVAIVNKEYFLKIPVSRSRNICGTDPDRHRNLTDSSLATLYLSTKFHQYFAHTPHTHTKISSKIH